MIKLHVFGIDVRIYKNRSAMHRGLKQNCISYCEFTAALLNGFDAFELVGTKLKKVKGLYGCMYLNEHNTVEEIAHECLHAATVILRKTRGKDAVDLGGEIHYKEERLAYLQTVILSRILREFTPTTKFLDNYKDLEEIEDFLKIYFKGFPTKSKKKRKPYKRTK